MGNWNDFSDSTDPVNPEFLAEREHVIAKPVFRVATREELLAKGYVLSLSELNLPTSPELNEIISVLQTQRGPVALAVWFQSANGWLGSASPADVVRGVSPGTMSDVLHAARREVAPIDHA
ncbi:hypothetical protein ACTG2W_02360 [Aeromonas sp. 96A]|uniref:hypothetical protein n=1 Tax=Aeromonas TaxID=642 RepID=UPI000D0E3D58|nr:hypothetical protein [Aeromonas veronii]MCR3972687.1 hypothetical protein [Aeromonas veronii]MCR3977006.1 hypothetical protein [Aeromonas veronii]PSJ88156.1 hypothetical protein CT153_12825 [Aeromonas veronii]